MKKLSEEVTIKTANLIRIQIPESERDGFTRQLQTALDSVGVLDELDTKSIPETSQTHGLTNVLSEDVVKPGLDMSKYKNTKNFRNGRFVVKKVI